LLGSTSNTIHYTFMRYYDVFLLQLISLKISQLFQTMPTHMKRDSLSCFPSFHWDKVVTVVLTQKVLSPMIMYDMMYLKDLNYPEITTILLHIDVFSQ